MSNTWLTLVPYVLILGIFYFVILLPMRKKQQKVEAFLQSLKAGDRVITTGGIYGQITKLNDQTVQLQIAEKIRIEVAKASIGGYQGQPAVVERSE
jgi:preprotein translocase subunit YajC